MSAESADLPLSFGAGQIVATTRHVRRTVGGGELDLHHWLAALLRHDVANEVLPDIDRTALAKELDRRFEEGHLDFPFPADEARARASQLARRAGHELVTPRDLGGAVATASAALLRRLAPPARTAVAATGRSSPAAGDGSSRRRGAARRWVADAFEDVLAWEGWAWLGAGLLAVAVVLPFGLYLSRQRANSAEEAVRDRVRDFAGALADGDGDGACEMLGDEAMDELVTEVRRRFAETEPRSCAAAVQLAASERTMPQDEALTDLEVNDVAYDEEWTTPINDDPGRFERATATAAVADGEVALLSETAGTTRSGAWTIEDPGPILDLVAPR